MEEVEPRNDGPREEQLEQVMLVEETVNSHESIKNQLVKVAFPSHSASSRWPRELERR